MATAKIMKRDVFTLTNSKWQRFSYKHELLWDAFYIDNGEDHISMSYLSLNKAEFPTHI